MIEIVKKMVLYGEIKINDGPVGPFSLLLANVLDHTFVRGSGNRGDVYLTNFGKLAEQCLKSEIIPCLIMIHMMIKC